MKHNAYFLLCSSLQAVRGHLEEYITRWRCFAKPLVRKMNSNADHNKIRLVHKSSSSAGVLHSTINKTNEREGNSLELAKKSLFTSL